MNLLFLDQSQSLSIWVHKLGKLYIEHHLHWTYFYTFKIQHHKSHCFCFQRLEKMIDFQIHTLKRIWVKREQYTFMPPVKADPCKYKKDKNNLFKVL